MLPQNIECEKLVLGSPFSTERAMDSLRSTLDPDDFSLQKHRKIWARMCELYDGGAAVDSVTVAHSLIRNGELQSCDGVNYLNEIADLPVIVNLDAWIQILKDKSVLRRIMRAAEDLVNRCAAGAETSSELRESIAHLAVDIAENGPANRRPISTAQMIKSIGVDELMRDRREQGVRLPWSSMNRAIYGLRPAQMIVLAAYTGRGKTSAALQIALHATRQGITPLIWTMEMEPKRLFRRLINQLTVGKYTHSMEVGEMSRQAIGWVNDHPIYFDSHSRTIPSFCASIRQVQAQREVGLVVVDYLQLIRMAGRVESRTREVGENSRSLKLAAMDFQIPFLVLSQFRRPNGNETATVHSLKESGDIENDADVILLMNSAELSGNDDCLVNVNIGKQREGPAGFDVPLMFNPPSQSFYSLED